MPPFPIAHAGRGRDISRAEFLRLTAGVPASVVAALMRTRVAVAQGVGEAEARVARVIQAYDAQGIHRTGTETDRRSASWLSDEARQAGAARVSLEPFVLDRIDPQMCRLEIDGKSVDGLPLFDGTFTTAAGVSGRLGERGSGADIILVHARAADTVSEGRTLADLRRGTQRAIVALTDGGLHAGLSPINAADFRAPYGVPVLQVSSEHGAWLDARAGAGAPVRLVAEATRTRIEAYNVIGDVPGSAPDLPPVVVMTPRSGWWQCASERGGGIVCWLEAIRAAARARARRTVRLVASSGHELGHLGLDEFLERRRELVTGAAAWVHLGANIGALGGVPRLQASDDGIEAMAAAALERAGAAVKQRVPRGTVPGGEARNIHIAGGRYVSLLGSNPYFHHPADRWPSAVDAPAVARFAAGVADLVVTLAASPD